MEDRWQGSGLTLTRKNNLMNFSLNNISGSSVHLWCVSLKGHSSDRAEYAHCLSKEEKERAGRFHFEEDRERYLISHGMLRRILASYVGKEPGSLCFMKSAMGKPELAPAPGEPMINFNLSHSAEMMLVGVSRDRRIGVDVELISPRIDLLRIAERYFTAEETAFIRAAPADQQGESFITLWTYKEAYLKAVGCGLSGGLRMNPLPEINCTEFVTKGIRGRSWLSGRWTLYSLESIPGYAAAVAVEGRDMDLCVKNADQVNRIMKSLGMQEAGAAAAPVKN
jgi:4'-phosphopantetheinyl transferase